MRHKQQAIFNLNIGKPNCICVIGGLNKLAASILQPTPFRIFNKKYIFLSYVESQERQKFKTHFGA